MANIKAQSPLYLPVKSFSLLITHLLLRGTLAFSLETVSVASASTLSRPRVPSLTVPTFTARSVKSSPVYSCWDDMKLLRTIHGEHGRFISAAPKHAEAYFKQACLNMGTYPTAFPAKGRRQVKRGNNTGFRLAKHDTGTARDLSQNAIVSTTFQSRHCNLIGHSPRLYMQPSDIEIILKKCSDDYFNNLSY